MSEVEEKQINEKTEKAKKAKNRTSLKNIIRSEPIADASQNYSDHDR